MKNNFILFLALLPLQPSISFADTEDKLWEKLKNGGLVILMRHASVEKGKQHGNPLLRDPSCVNERKLSDKGKQQASQIGKTFTSKGIPIEQVLNSPYCRTTDTAIIAFNKSQPVEFLSLLEVLSQSQAEASSKKLSLRIGSYSGKGNLIMVSHAPNINAISFETIEPAAFIVLSPMGGDEFEEIGSINPAQ